MVTVRGMRRLAFFDDIGSLALGKGDITALELVLGLNIRFELLG
jgi:hypothetical protein